MSADPVATVQFPRPAGTAVNLTHLAPTSYGGVAVTSATLCGISWTGDDGALVGGDRGDNPANVHGLCLTAAHERGLEVAGEHRAAQSVRNLLAEMATPPAYDRRRVRIVIEADVDLSVIGRSRPAPGPDIVSHIDRTLVAAVEAVEGISGARSTDTAVTGP